MSNIRNPINDTQILEYLEALSKLLPVFTPDAILPSSPKESIRLASIYDLAERTISTAKKRIIELELQDDHGETYKSLRSALAAVCKRMTPRPFPTSFVKDEGYFLQVFQAITTAFSVLVLPHKASWYAKRLAIYRLTYFNDFDSYLPVLEASRKAADRNPGVVKYAVDLAWTLHAALNALRAYPTQRESSAAPLFLELEQTVSLIPEKRLDPRLTQIVERHRHWIKSPPGEFEGWELLAEFKALGETQELNEANVNHLVAKYSSLKLSTPCKLHSSFTRRLLANQKNAPVACCAYFKQYGPETFLPEDFQFHQFKGRKYPPIALRTARFLAEQLLDRKLKDFGWVAPYLEAGASILPERKLLQGLYYLALKQEDHSKCRDLATQLVTVGPNWFKHWEMLADCILDDEPNRLACLSAALLCPVSNPKYLSKVFKKWLISAQKISLADEMPGRHISGGTMDFQVLASDLLIQMRSKRLQFAESKSIIAELFKLASPIKESLFGQLDWVPAVIFSKGSRKKGVLEVAFVLNDQKQLARTRLEQYPFAIKAKTGDPIAIRVQTQNGSPLILDIRERDSGKPWDSLPPVNVEVLGPTDIGRGIKVKSDKGKFVLLAKRFPDVQDLPSGVRGTIRLAINARTKLWEPVDAEFSTK